MERFTFYQSKWQKNVSKHHLLRGEYAMMRRCKRIAVTFFLFLFSIMAFHPRTMYANNDTSHVSKGLSRAARQTDHSLFSAGPLETFSGQLHILYGDAPSDSGIPATTGYVLIDKHAQAIELLFGEQALRTLGSPMEINQQHLAVTGQVAVAPLADGTAAMPLVTVHALTRNAAHPEAAAAAVSAEVSPTSFAVSGPQPWATLLCRFGDSPGVTTHPIEWFQTLMLGTTAPGLDHYWRELSFNNVNLAGSAVYGWYTLPQPRSYYVSGSPEQLNHQKAANDCTAVANPNVNFPTFVGINLMFNGQLDGYAWGGSWTMTLDGETKSYRMTWLPPWGYENQGPVGHEMGHGFGLPHSSGAYGATYDSRWDVMSDIWDNCRISVDPIYGCVGPHTISYHKDILGWIPSTQKYVATPNTEQTITMERLGQPTSGTSYLMAQIPINGSTTQFYTVEARRFAGYDAKLPGEAVVIHRVDTALWDRDAQVVDPDRNGNPNDDGAMWVTSETFIDPGNGITVSTLSSTPTSFQVKIKLGDPNPPQPDLIIQVLSNPPATIVMGGSFAVTDAIYNSGTAAAGASTTRYRLSTDATITSSDYLLTGTRNVAALEAGSSSSSYRNVTVPTNVPEGTYFLGACADDLGAVTESNETNNCKASSTTIQVRATSTQPDLVVSTLSPLPSSLWVGASFTVTDTIFNSGTASAGASTTRYRLSTDATITNADPLLTGTRSIPSLAAGINNSGSVTVTVPTSVPVGTYYLGGCADDLGNVAESNETNNCKASSATIQVRAAPAQPDLVVSAVSFSPGFVRIGSSFTALDTTGNSGTTTALKATTTRYYLSTDTTITSSDVRLTTTRSVPSLKAGNSNSGSRAVTVPANVPAGAYYLGACADDLNLTAESNEINNCKASSTTIQVTVEPTRPDLFIDALSLSTTSVSAGGSFTVTSTTTNTLGTMTAAKSTTRFRLSTDTTITSGDQPLPGTRNIPTLAGGASNSGSITVTVPASVPAGTYYLGGCADDLGNVAESNETNNCKASSATIQVLPLASRVDLTVKTITPSTNSVSRSGSLTIADTTQNAGIARLEGSTTRYRFFTNTSLTGSSRLLTGSRNIPSLTAGTSNSGNTLATIPADVPVGSYILAACADDLNIITESDEQNNCRAAGMTIKVW